MNMMETCMNRNKNSGDLRSLNTMMLLVHRSMWAPNGVSFLSLRPHYIPHLSWHFPNIIRSSPNAVRQKDWKNWVSLIAGKRLVIIWEEATMIGVRRRLKGEIYSMVISQHPQKYIPTNCNHASPHLRIDGCCERGTKYR